MQMPECLSADYARGGWKFYSLCIRVAGAEVSWVRNSRLWGLGGGHVWLCRVLSAGKPRAETAIKAAAAATLVLLWLRLQHAKE